MIKNVIGIFFLIISSTSCASIPNYKRSVLDKKTSSLVLTGYGRYSYTKGNVNYYLNELELLNANTATFLYSCQTKTLSSSNIDCKSDYTPTLKSIKMAIGLAKERGLKVSVRHYIDVESKEWRCHWKPKNKKKAFKNIKKELTQFSKVLEDYKVETFTIGAEYCEITGKEYQNEWKDIIKSIRGIFHGKLSYGANWQEENGKNEFYSTSFWADLDYIGLDLYSPIPDNIKGKNIYNHQLKVISKFNLFAKKLKKNLFINEVGFSGSSKGTSEPFEWRNKIPGSQERQANAYKYTLKALKSFQNIKGIFIWRKLATNKYKMLEYKSNETDYDLWKRKAWYEIKNIFNSL